MEERWMMMTARDEVRWEMRARAIGCVAGDVLGHACARGTRTGRQAVRQTGRQAVRQTGRQAVRQTDGLTLFLCRSLARARALCFSFYHPPLPPPPPPLSACLFERGGWERRRERGTEREKERVCVIDRERVSEGGREKGREGERE